MEKLKARIYGKAASYYVNAIVDAQIANALLDFINKRDFHNADREVNERVKNIIKNISHKNKNERLLIQAFTYKYANGYANYWYSKKILKLINMEIPDESKYFSDIKNHLPIQLIKIIISFPETIKDYADKLNIKFTLGKTDIKNEILNVQNNNIIFNKNNSLKIGENKSDTWKVRELLKLSKKCRYPEVFLASAASTQLSANRWDKIYISLL